MIIAAMAAFMHRGPAAAQVKPAPPSPQRTGSDLVRVTLAADIGSISPGSRFHLALIFDIEPHWHIYWRNSGASGLPTEVQITAPDGFTVGKPLYPRPVPFRDEAGTSYGHEGRAVIFVPMTAPAALAGSEVTFEADVRWMVCKGICLLGSAMPSLTLQAGSEPSLPAARLQPVLEAHKARIPKPLREQAGARITYAASSLTLIVPAEGRTSAAFFPYDDPGVEYGAATIVGGGSESFQIAIKIGWSEQNALGRPFALGGVVALGTGADEPSFDFELMPPSP